MFLQSQARGLSLYTPETSATGCGLARESGVNLGLDYSLEGLTAGLCQLAELPAAQSFTSEEEYGWWLPVFITKSDDRIKKCSEKDKEMLLFKELQRGCFRKMQTEFRRKEGIRKVID